MAGKPLVHVAVGVIRRGDRVLIARRPDHVHQGGLLEFPGGKVEPGETVQNALVREIREETGLSVPVSELMPLIGIRHDYGDKCVFLDVWEGVSRYDEPEGKEGQQVEWRNPLVLADEDFPAANRPIIRALRLPRSYAITGKASGPEDYLQRLKRSLPGSNLSLCLLRAPELDQESYHELVAGAIRPADWNAGVQWMLHGALQWLHEFPQAAGLHMPWREARRYSRRPIDGRYLLAVSCHNAEEIQHAIRLEADFITLGPVKLTDSHPGAAPLGCDRFRALVSTAPVVVYGLGGLGRADEHAMITSGAQGVAGIGFWWPAAVPKQ
ncbi:Nudix family hydrolase [Marinobacter sp.]|uniref:Nudix family hydrolase n=1 Tax=Marinobacter sp. TaxID=50741 RepID=UPI002B4A04CC|nr:Nudix family hydrolase [Marinobacter sp.]HKK55071.1 Nudix family hydrolase [Marinobacter sp.]